MIFTNHYQNRTLNFKGQYFTEDRNTAGNSVQNKAAGFAKI